jgi:ABC-2 type transport system permease protein
VRSNTWFLVSQLAWTDFKLRYNSLVLGYFWSLLHPLLMFGVFTLVFSVFVKIEGIPHYPLYLLLGIILWNYFAESTTSGMQSIQFKAGLISKVYVPKGIILAAANITSLLTLFLNMGVFAIFFAASAAKLTAQGWLFFLSLFELFALSFALSLLLSSYYLKFRDFSYLWSVALQVGFWLTPIIYPVGFIPRGWRWLFFWNPLARIIQDGRAALLGLEAPSVGHHLVSLAMVAAALALGIAVFVRRSARFAEEI